MKTIENLKTSYAPKPSWRNWLTALWTLFRGRSVMYRMVLEEVKNFDSITPNGFGTGNIISWAIPTTPTWDLCEETYEDENA